MDKYEDIYLFHSSLKISSFHLHIYISLGCRVITVIYMVKWVEMISSYILPFLYIYKLVVPSCGLVALCMAANMLNLAEKSLDVVLSAAIEKGYTLQGEMFSGKIRCIYQDVCLYPALNQIFKYQYTFLCAWLRISLDSVFLLALCIFLIYYLIQVLNIFIFLSWIKLNIEKRKCPEGTHRLLYETELVEP